MDDDDDDEMKNIGRFYPFLYNCTVPDAGGNTVVHYSAWWLSFETTGTYCTTDMYVLSNATTP